MELSVRQRIYQIYIKWAKRILILFLSGIVVEQILLFLKILKINNSGKIIFSNFLLFENLKNTESIGLAILIMFLVYVIYKTDREINDLIQGDMKVILDGIEKEDYKENALTKEFEFIRKSIESKEKEKTIAQNESKNKDKFLKLKIAYLNHDIKTPLSIIKSNAEMLEEDGLKKRDKDRLLRLKSNTDEISSLVDELQNIIETWTKEKSIAKEYGLKSLMEKLKDNLEIYSNSFEERLATSIDVNNGKIIKIDYKSLEKAVINVLSNAFKYGGDDRVTINIDNDEEYLYINVEDNGEGFTDPSKAKELFFTENKARSLGKGYGIGLYFADSYLKSNGGSLDIINKEGGKGAIVVIKLPLIEDERE
ncbi:MAG: sensor histidine kinase [Tissierella sp.]|uniref:sensor histidine kinase n=1 Tax=Tissierella sp. TaxID=41274 RepID=UPI003F9BF788